MEQQKQQLARVAEAIAAGQAPADPLSLRVVDSAAVNDTLLLVSWHWELLNGVSALREECETAALQGVAELQRWRRFHLHRLLQHWAAIQLARCQAVAEQRQQLQAEMDFLTEDKQLRLESLERRQQRLRDAQNPRLRRMLEREEEDLEFLEESVKFTTSNLEDIKAQQRQLPSHCLDALRAVLPHSLAGSSDCGSLTGDLVETSLDSLVDEAPHGGHSLDI